MARTCASCGVNLAQVNTNPDDLCGECQQFLRPGYKRYQAWIARGKPGKREIIKMFPIREIHRRTKAQIMADRAKANGGVPVASATLADRGTVSPRSAPVVTESAAQAAANMHIELLIACFYELKRRMREAKKLDALRAHIHKDD